MRSEDAETASRLSEPQIRAYQAHGHHWPVDVVNEAEAATLRAKLEAHEAAHGPLKEVKPHLLFTWLDDLVRNERLLDALESILGPDILCWGSSFFVKEARSPEFVTWHQDGEYIGLTPHEMVTAWIALTPSNASNGAMRVVPGTHLHRFTHRETFAPDNLLSRGQEITVDIDEKHAVMMELRAGQCSLHNTLLVHGSDPNPSDDRRIGIAVRYIPPHVRQVADVQDSALLVRGKDRHGHFEHERSSTGDFTPEVRAYHRTLAQRNKQVVFSDKVEKAEDSATGRWN